MTCFFEQAQEDVKHREPGERTTNVIFCFMPLSGLKAIGWSPTSPVRKECAQLYSLLSPDLPAYWHS